MKILGLGIAGIAGIGMSGCLGFGGQNSELPPITEEKLTLTTTTSTYDTGLLDVVNEAFEKRYGVSVEAIAQGTGAALETARNGDSEVVMVHARELEDNFIKDGVGINRRDLMFNDFVIVGSTDDPAEIAGIDSATEAFEKIAKTESVFISRGDNSGTHAKELDIWSESNAEPGGEWYREAGEGMGPILNQTNMEGAYTLADRGTYLSMKGDIDLEILVEGPIEDGPEILMNPYGIIVVNPAVHDHVKYDIAMAYVGFLTSKKGHNIVENYTVEDEQLFFPTAVSEKPNFQQYVPKEWEP